MIINSALTMTGTRSYLERLANEEHGDDSDKYLAHSDVALLRHPEDTGKGKCCKHITTHLLAAKNEH